MKIIDFGEAALGTKNRGRLIGTNQYRAPEITLGQHRTQEIFLLIRAMIMIKSFKGLQWTKAVDIFAAGCVIAELSSCKVLLPFTEDRQERLASFERVIHHFSYDYARIIERSNIDIFDSMDPPRVRFPTGIDGDSALKLEQQRRISNLPTLRVSVVILHMPCYMPNSVLTSFRVPN